MTFYIAIYLTLLAVALVWIVVRDHKEGRCELLSCRNIAIGGLILFQVSSAAYSLFTGDYSNYFISRPAAAGLQFAAMVTTLVVLSLWAYRRGWLVTGLARRVPATHTIPGDTALLLNAFLVTLLAAALRFGVMIPLVSIVAGAVGVGMSAVAGGLVGWVWGRRLLNPAIFFYGSLIIAANLAIVMSGAFGRRGLVAVGGSIAWGMYYSYWRHLRLSGILSRMAMIALPPMIFLALFTSVRSSAEHERTATEHIQEITRGGDVVRGMIGLLNGQYAGSISMFLIENYPENYEYRHLESITYFFMLPIPRRWWEGKPIPLSMEVARQARLSKVDWNRLKLGPGIIGHAAAEGGWYALIIYAIVAGLYFRFFDEVVRLNINSPFVVLAVGSAMGQYLGLPRGSVPNFAFIAVMTVTGALLIMIVLSKLVEKFSPSPEFAVDDEDQWETYEAWDEAADRP